ncbi:MAG: hypothetical protein B7Y84_03575 [Azorhizobium sp. 32-67-21]|nr:MAG: hypothetical protein B7Y84_03575 [Azorhizobium sp. 32-67-21]
MLKRRDFLVSSALLLGAAITPSLLKASTAEYPNRPIKLIVPFAPGGGVDVFARLIAQKLKDLKGYTVVVDNRSGANGSVGGNAVRKSDPDGYTLLFSAGTQAMTGSVMKTPPYDPVADFAPIALAGQAPMILVMANNRPQTTIAEIVASARKKPEDWNFAVSAMGSPGHLATLEFNRLAGLDLNVIPYRGTAPGLLDVSSGNVRRSRRWRKAVSSPRSVSSRRPKPPPSSTPSSGPISKKARNCWLRRSSSPPDRQGRRPATRPRPQPLRARSRPRRCGRCYFGSRPLVSRAAAR